MLGNISQSHTTTPQPHTNLIRKHGQISITGAKRVPGAKRAHPLLTSYSNNRKPPRLGCNLFFFLMPPSTFYFQFKIVKLSFYSRPENFFWEYEIGECVYEIQKCLEIFPNLIRPLLNLIPISYENTGKSQLRARSAYRARSARILY